jgi:putative acetyltransferase
MNIRETVVDDHPAIHRIVERAFGQSAEADLVDALRITGDAIIDLVAETEGGIDGHILLSALAAPEGCLALAPVSVSPDRQGEGIGSALIRRALADATGAGWSAVFVLGEPEYYGRFGFAAEMAAEFNTEYPRAYFMALELREGGLDGRDPAVVYPEPFRALG